MRATTMVLPVALLLGGMTAAAGAPLHEAARKGDAARVKRLLAEGADVNARAIYDHTPLHYTARGGHVECARLLLAGGADVNAKESRFGWTPLHYAAHEGHTELATLLLDCGADVNGGREEETPLHRAVYAASPEMVALLLARGADADPRGRWGTPRRKAEFLGRVWAARAEYTTNPERKARWQKSCERIAAVTDLLRQHGGRSGR